MTSTAVHKREHLINLLGAFVQSLGDEVQAAVQDEIGTRGAGPAALLAVDTWPGCSIDFLRGVLGLTHSGTARLVARLRASRLVERGEGSDGRTAALTLTDQGRRLAARARGARRAVLERALAGLTHSERGLLGRILDDTLRGASRTRTQAQRSCRLCDHTVCRGDACPIGASVDVD